MWGWTDLDQEMCVTGSFGPDTLMGLPLEKLPDWPAAMSREEALAYTGVAETQLREWERRGVVRFRPRGPSGRSIAPRADLDAALATLFDGANYTGPIEFD